MRRSRLLRLLGFLCLGVAAVQFAADVHTHAFFFQYESQFAWDARLRHNEIKCAHEGINSFFIWDRSITHEKYRGLERPDMEEEEESAEKKESAEKLPVHSYPAWHTAFLWFAGWMSLPLYLGVLYACFGLALAAFWKLVSARAPADPESKWLYFGLLSIPLAGRILACFATGNYGLFMALLVFGLICSVNAKRSVWTGILWAVMMVKPQIAVLMFWPLVVRKNYVAIGLAGAICVAGTLLVSFVYGCSPVELIAQIPKIGAPYTSAPKGIQLVFGPLFGTGTKWIWPFLMFALCGIMTWRLRRCGTWWMFMPAVLLFPVWTYSQPHDGVAQWPFYALVALLFTSAETMADNRQKKMAFAYGCIVISIFFTDTALTVADKINSDFSWLRWKVFGVARVVFWVSGLFVLDRLASHAKMFDLCRVAKRHESVPTCGKEEGDIC